MNGWRSVSAGFGLFGALALTLVCATQTEAYDKYNKSGSDDCAACHGDFRHKPYTSLSDGQSWGDSLHNVHRYDMLDGNCSVCHSSGDRSPVRLNKSAGGKGLDPISCIGCHGRAEDRGMTPADCADPGSSGVCGDGAGLRQHHFTAGVNECAACHPDSDPASFTPVGEDVMPPYYSNPPTSSHPSAPTDPCNPLPDFPEDYAGTTLGLDNDGDDVYDAADADCPATPLPTPTPTPTPIPGPSKNEQACINGMNKQGAKLEKLQLKEVGKCLKGLQKNKLSGSFEECIVADNGGKVAKAEGQTLSMEQDKCGTLPAPPPFGYSSGAAVNMAAAEGALALAREIFGDPVDDADLYLKENATAKEAACQSEMLKGASKLEETLVKELVKTKKKGLKESTTNSAAALQTAFEPVWSSPKVAKAETKLAEKVDKKCLGLPTAPDALFPGGCADASLANVEDCVIAAARCQACLKIDAFDALSLDCDDLDNGAADLSCP